MASDVRIKQINTNIKLDMKTLLLVDVISRLNLIFLFRVLIFFFFFFAAHLLLTVRGSYWLTGAKLKVKWTEDVNVINEVHEFPFLNKFQRKKKS